jgi:hypothetical protein
MTLQQRQACCYSKVDSSSALLSGAVTAWNVTCNGVCELPMLVFSCAGRVQHVQHVQQPSACAQDGIHVHMHVGGWGAPP